jgi:acyl carrier protein
MENKILEIINAVRANKLLKPIIELNNEMDLRNDLGFDSFDLAELTVRIEDEFEIDIFANGLVNNIGQIKTILNG